MMNKTIEKYRMLSDTLDTVATLDKDENIETVLAFNQLLKRTTEEQLRLINVTKEIISNKSLVKSR